MGAIDFKTIILRFRDLSIKDTIMQHKILLDENGYVWWGWWAKPQEKVPIYECNYLNKRCTPCGLEIYLFDSGKRCLYSAICSEIRYLNGDKISSPQPECTPSYYSDTEYMIWFKLTSISDCMSNENAIDTLRKLSYYQVDDFFVSGHSPFTPFYNKMVYSLSELAEQQRTIWFVRDHAIGDESHEIFSYSHAMTSGKTIETEFKVLKSKNILWLSDLHFSEYNHAFISTVGSDNKLSMRLYKELEILNINQISSVIISGDITYSAKSKEYDMAEEFIKDLNSLYSLDESNYSISPGNHDIAFSKGDYNDRDRIQIAFESAKENFVSFFRRIKKVEPTEKLYSICRVLSPDLVPIEIISVNSCLLQQIEDHFRGMGFVGNDQLLLIEKELSLTKDTNVFRILVMHHHLIPVMFTEEPKADTMYSMMLDSGAITQFILKNNIKLVLHGHTHKEFYSEIIRKYEDKKKKFYVIGLGSTGVTSLHLSENSPNMFSVLTIEDNNLKVTLYDIHNNGSKSKILEEHIIPIEEKVE